MSISPKAKHYLKVAAAIVAIALILEATIFNFRFYQTLFLDEVDVSEQMGLVQDTDGFYELTSDNNAIELKGLDCEVKTLWIEFEPKQRAQDLSFKIDFTDAAHSKYFSGTDYTSSVPEVSISTVSGRNKYITLQTSGNVGDLRITLVDEEAVYPVLIESMSINKTYPFWIDGFRIGIVIIVLALCYCFRPKSSLYRISVTERPRFARRGMVVAIVLESLLACVLMFGTSSSMVGIATAFYNWGEWDETSLVNTYEAAGDNAQQYAELAIAMTEGKLYLNQDPPQWLKDMDDPYDTLAREELAQQTGVKALHDTAYYDGHYYVYFGVLPVLLFYLPFYVLFGTHFPTAIGVLIAVLFFIVGCSLLLMRFAMRHFKQVSLGLYLLLQIPLVACSGVLYLLKFPTFYSLPIACALALGVWGFYFWMAGRASKRPAIRYAAGSLCMGLILACRPQLLALSLVAIPLFWRKFITERHILTKRGGIEFACLVAPYVIVMAALMWYNAARFGSPFDFGANYNLTVSNMTVRGLNIERIVPAIFAYFIQPPTVSGVFPFIEPAVWATTYIGETVKEVTFGGIFACLPVLWIIFCAKPLLSRRKKERDTRTVSGVVFALIIGGLLVALFDAEMAGILQRYYADFSFMFLAAAVLLGFIANEAIQIDCTPGQRKIIHCVALALVFVSLLYVVLICFVPETGWYSDIYGWAYRDLLETFLFM